MSAPMVTGAVALLLQKNPALNPDQVKAILMKTAVKFPQGTSVATDPVTGITYTSQYDIFTIGAGYLNIPSALANGDVFTGSALSPAASYDTASGNVYIGPNNISWGTNIAWGSGAVWGGSVFVSGTGAVWGGSAVWGTNVAGDNGTPYGFGAVWGGSAVWGTGSPVQSDAFAIAIAGEN